MKQIHQTRICAGGATFAPFHYNGALSVLRDLRGIVVLCHTSQVPTVLYAMSEHPFKLPVVGSLHVNTQHVKFMDIETGGVEYMVDSLSIPAVQGQIEDQTKGEYNGH